MRASSSRIHSVFCGYPSGFFLRDIIDLTLVYDSIYDGGGALEFAWEAAPALAEFLRTKDLSPEEMKKWGGLSDVFVMLLEACKYAGYDPYPLVLSKYENEALKVDELFGEKHPDSAFFLNLVSNIIDEVGHRKPHVIDELTKILSEIPLFFDEGIIKSHDPNIARRMRKALGNLPFEAMDLDANDKMFRSFTSKCFRDQSVIWREPHWIAFLLNSQLLESSYLRMPLHLTPAFLPLLRYKMLRGAKYDVDIDRRNVLVETFSTLVPEIYFIGISEHVRLRKSHAFKGFRREFLKMFSDEERPDSRCIRETYLKEIEELAITRSPRPHRFLVKTIVSLAHPIAGLLLSGKDVYDEYVQRYQKWKLAVSVIDFKREIRKEVGKPSYSAR
jgi:hypothetical protein